MSRPLRVGVVGAGLVAQVVHLPNLLRLRDKFRLVSIADPSPTVTRKLAERYGLDQVYLDWQELLIHDALDAVIICAPTHTHADIVLAAIDHGLHVLVEKPICIDPADAHTIARRSRERSVVVQVGYMKRYDPMHEGFVEALPDSIDDLRLISVLTRDPWLSREPFVQPEALVVGSDLPAGLREEGQESERRQVRDATGHSDARSVRAFSYTFLTCMIHDVNLVLGALDAMKSDGSAMTPLAGSEWADGTGASISIALPNGAIWNCVWVQLPGLDSFHERVSFYFRDAMHELVFPSPYDPSAPTRRTVERGQGSATSIARSEGGFVNELRHFYECATSGVPCRTPPEQAARDLELLRAAFLASGEPTHVQSNNAESCAHE